MLHCGMNSCGPLGAQATFGHSEPEIEPNGAHASFAFQAHTYFSSCWVAFFKLLFIFNQVWAEGRILQSLAPPEVGSYH